MRSTKKTARLAGLVYLLVALPGFYGLLYVPSKVLVRGNPSATARNILASPTFFRSGIVADLLGQVAFILVGLLLYRLLKHVDRTAAGLMFLLVVVSIPIVFVAEVDHLSALSVLDPSGPAAAFGQAQREALMANALRAYSNTILVSEIFWGLWLLPLALLIWKSEFLPRFLGVFLLLAGSSYLVESLTRLLLPAGAEAVDRITGPLRALELALPLWLLIVGAKDRPLPD